LALRRQIIITSAFFSPEIPDVEFQLYKEAGNTSWHFGAGGPEFVHRMIPRKVD